MPDIRYLSGDKIMYPASHSGRKPGKFDILFMEREKRKLINQISDILFLDSIFEQFFFHLNISSIENHARIHGECAYRDSIIKLKSHKERVFKLTQRDFLNALLNSKIQKEFRKWKEIFISTRLLL